MALKYFIQYQDIEDITHRLDIYDDNYLGVEIEIFGNIVLDFAQTEKTLEPIRGNGLSVQLEANLDLTFEELYTSAERTYLVQYQRNSIVLFNGWINPEGYYESFITDTWYITLDCVDGLSFLENLSYVENATGLFFTGKQSQLEVISNCLLRTGINENINTNIDIYYTGLSTALDILDNVFVNTARFVKDDGETIMSCVEVLKDVLEPYAACITMHLGEWYIYKPNQIYSENDPAFFRYDYLGVALAPTTTTLNLREGLGSQIDGFYPHHVNRNQGKSIDRGFGAYRINYKYGFVTNLIENIYLQNLAGVITDWTIGGSADLTLPASGEFGVFLPYDWNDNDPTLVEMTSNTIAVGSAEVLRVGFTIQPDPDQEYLTFFSYRVKITSGGTFYYYNESTGLWQLTTIYINQVDVGLSTVLSDLTTAPTPISGDITIEVIKPVASNSLQTGAGFPRELTLTKATVTPDTQENVQGEIITLQRTDDPSTKVEETVEVFTGDTPSDLYVGTLYKTDELTPTETWFRKGVTEAFPVLRIMGEETMRINANNMILFSGDIYGYLPYLSVLTINNVSGFYMFIEYSYDTKNNIITGKLKQIYGDELTDLIYTSVLDYGNVVRPTIIG